MRLLITILLFLSSVACINKHETFKLVQCNENLWALQDDPSSFIPLCRYDSTFLTLEDCENEAQSLKNFKGFYYRCEVSK